MSVLKSKRSESKAEFVNTANKIYAGTVGFVSRMSSRYSRLLATDTMRLASEVLDNAEQADSIFPSDTVRSDARERHLIEARASLMALDVHLAHCYNIMTQNPSGCFEKGSGGCVDAASAKRRLDNMAQNLGELIDRENGYLTSILKSDQKRKK